MEQAGDAGGTPALVAAWLPNVALAAIGSVLLIAQSRKPAVDPDPGGPAPA
jgi:lipopolysaccharide export LptBFGC system permease protein LptF